MSLPYCINVDWLQVFCADTNNGNLDVLYNPKGLYEFKLLPYQSRHFKELWEVLTPDGDHYATIQRLPHSSIISKDAAIIQLQNRFLYRNNMAKDFSIFLDNYGFKYKSISRLDICFDSNKLYNGLRHRSIIKGLMIGNYLKNNQSKVKWHFDAIANVGNPMECNSCSFGSLSSSVSTKMYNKTKELSEVKDKPYIRDTWRANGLSDKEDVWRIEIAIKADAKNMLHTSTGELVKINLYDHLFKEQIVDVFISYAKKYFAFKVNDGTKNKTRMKDLQLFPKELQPSYLPMTPTTDRDSNRSDRNFISKFEKIKDELSYLPRDDIAILEEASNIVAARKRLIAYQVKIKRAKKI